MIKSRKLKVKNTWHCSGQAPRFETAKKHHIIFDQLTNTFSGTLQKQAVLHLTSNARVGEVL